MTKILDSSRPEISLVDFPVGRVESFLKTKLLDHGVQEAYLFGSYAQGKATAWSDLDLLIVMDTDHPFLERSSRFSDLFELGVPIDILVYTPGEFASLGKEGSGFWREFQKHHLRLI